jgi:hypothetical protein
MQTIGRKIHHDSSFPPFSSLSLRLHFLHIPRALFYPFSTHMPLSSIFYSRMKVFSTSKHTSHNSERENKLSPLLIFDSYRENEASYPPQAILCQTRIIFSSSEPLLYSTILSFSHMKGSKGELQCARRMPPYFLSPHMIRIPYTNLPFPSYTSNRHLTNASRQIGRHLRRFETNKSRVSVAGSQNQFSEAGVGVHSHQVHIGYQHGRKAQSLLPFIGCEPYHQTKGMEENTKQGLEYRSQHLPPQLLLMFLLVYTVVFTINIPKIP